ncbi:hypothetical protein [Parasitella parasitica]|uniref:Uncharacterized protein n=1 Tax=Parasitella parasitica TaxID=35722 RepID=A0A0B7NQL3_9FUNG|nr:hypothetical protein [Parasitella parasitica]
MDWIFLICNFKKPLVDTRNEVGVKASTTLQDFFHLIVDLKSLNCEGNRDIVILTINQISQSSPIEPQHGLDIIPSHIVFNLFLDKISDISLRGSTDNFIARGGVVSSMLPLAGRSDVDEFFVEKTTLPTDQELDTDGDESDHGEPVPTPASASSVGGGSSQHSQSGGGGTQPSQSGGHRAESHAERENSTSPYCPESSPF